jgi:hypothetical protein
MSYKTTENLIAALESFSSEGSFAAANRAIGATSNGTIWAWVAKAKAAKEINDRSFWYLTWRETDGWWTDFILRARAEQCLMLDGLVRQQTALGVENICYNPTDGRPLVALADEYAHLSQQQFDELRDFLDQPLDPRDRYQWTDSSRTVPVYQIRVEQVPASLRQKTMSSVVPGWRDTMQVEQTNRIAVTVIAPAPWLPKAEREQANLPGRHLDVVDAEFEPVALPPPKSIDELRAERKAILLRQAEEFLNRPDRTTRPDPNHPARYDGSGRPTHNEPQERAGERDAKGEAPTASTPYVAPKPVAMATAPMGPTPSYIRRANGQPRQGVRSDGSREPMRVVKT